MTKRIIATLLCTIMVASLLPGTIIAEGESGTDFVDGYYTYTVTDGEATITDVDESIFGEIAIPDILGGYPVVKIGAYAFDYCQELTGVVIPSSVKSVGREAFYNCSSLANISLPTSLTQIEEYTFAGCSFTDVTIPQGVKYIGNYAFDSCSNLENVFVPASVEEMSSYTFANCSNLSSIVVDESNPIYKSAYGVLYSADGTELICYPAAKAATSFVIPAEVTTIKNNAFYHCNNLERIVIPTNVATIESQAFTYYSTCFIYAESADKPEGWEDGWNAWNDNMVVWGYTAQTEYTDGYYTYTVTDGEATITDVNTAISGDITIPATLGGYPVKGIGIMAFAKCNGLSTVTIPAHITTVQKYVFCDYVPNIYVEATDKPEGWDEEWNSSGNNVVWGYAAVAGIGLDRSELTLTTHDWVQLFYTIYPENASNCNVSWSSSDTSVAEVDFWGNVRAISNGTATITVTTEDGGFTAACDVTVNIVREGWYKAPEATDSNLLSNSEYYGVFGEEITLYYFCDNSSLLSKILVIGDGDAILDELDADKISVCNGMTIDPTNFEEAGYIAVTTIVSDKSINLRFVFENENVSYGWFRLRIDNNLPALWLKRGNYNSYNNTYSQNNNGYNNGISVQYLLNARYYQFYYGTQENYGDPIDLKSWSYTAPQGISGSSVTVTEKTDKNGVVFYEISAQYLGDESFMGILNVTLSDDTQQSFAIYFSKPSNGWYEDAEDTAANYVAGNTYYGRNGEEKTLYYFYSGNGTLTKVEIQDGNRNKIGEISADEVYNSDGVKIDPTKFATKGYIAVTAAVPSNNIRFKLVFDGYSIEANCSFQIDPTLPALWLKQGNYNSYNNTYSQNNNRYSNSLNVQYVLSVWYYQFYYGTQENYGDPIDLKSWSYTAPQGISGSSVTVTEKTDKNGVVFYEISAQYLGDESFTGILNVTLSDDTQESFAFNFSKPSNGWYEDAEDTAANYVADNKYYGRNGEEKTLYFFYNTSNPLVSVQIIGDRDAVLKEFDADETVTYNGFKIDPTKFATKGYVAVTSTVTGNDIRLKLIFDGDSIWANCSLRVDPTLPSLWLKRGNYNSYQNTYSQSNTNYSNSINVQYVLSTQYYQFYYGTQENYGDPIDLKSWSYTAPQGISGSSVTVTEKTDKNGVVFYEISAQYLGDESFMGILNVTLSDDTQESFAFNFSKPYNGWYTEPQDTAENYVANNTYLGASGEEKTLYYFYSSNRTFTGIQVLNNNNQVQTTLAADKVSSYGGMTFDPTNFTSKGYIAVTAKVTGQQVRLKLIFDGSSQNINCSFNVDPTIPAFYLNQGELNGSNEFRGNRDYTNSISVNYSTLRDYQFYYGTQDNYGDPIDITSWSYTAPEGITGSSVTVKKMTDKHGVEFYRITAQYLENDSCTGTLNITFGENKTVSIPINFSKPNKGWYAERQEIGANYVADNKYMGVVGEKTLYYFYNANSTLSKIQITGDRGEVLAELPANQLSSYDGMTIDPTKFAGKGYIAVTTVILMNQTKNIMLKLVFEDGMSQNIYCRLVVDPSLPSLRFKTGTYYDGEFNLREFWYGRMEFGFSDSRTFQFYYGTEEDPGESLKLQNWSYAVPGDASSFSVSITEVVDRFGVVGYILDGTYLGSGERVLDLDLSFAGDITARMQIEFGDRGYGGVYTQPIEEGRYFCRDGVYGFPGEEITLYYFPPKDREYVKIMATLDKEYNDLTEIPLNAVTIYKLFEIDTTRLATKGYIAVTSTVTENLAERGYLRLRLEDSTGRLCDNQMGMQSDIVSNYNMHDMRPAFNHQGSTYIFGAGRLNNHMISFIGKGSAEDSWQDETDRIATYVVGAHKRDGAIEQVATKEQFDKYITNVTLEIDKNAAGQLMYYNGTSQDADAFKMEVIKDDTAAHPWSIKFTVKKEHLISVRVKITITVQMPDWDEPKSYECYKIFAARKQRTDYTDFVFDASAYNTADKLNALLAMNSSDFQIAFRENSFEEYEAYLAAAPIGNSDSRSIILHLPAVEYDNVIYYDCGRNEGMVDSIEGTEQNGKRTTIPALVLDSTDERYGSSLGISNIDFVAKEGIKVSRGDKELSCGIMAYNMVPTIQNVYITGYEVGVYSTRASISRNRFEKNGIGYLLSADELDGDISYDVDDVFSLRIAINDFIDNDIAIKMEKLPEGATAIGIRFSNNNFIDNDRDMDMANGDLGALFYAYNNYFGWTMLGVPTPRTAIVELGKDTIVATNPRRWAPYGSGDNRLYVDVLYPGVTWIVNSQSSELLISTDLLDQENDTEMTVTDEQGNKVGKWKFEGGKKNK